MEEVQKMVRVTLSHFGKENVEESVRNMFEVYEDHEDIHGVQVVVDQVDTEEAIGVLESLTEGECSVNVEKMVVGVTRQER